jgi:murein DD-endopeptidase MepM/ murein hydrolase activator NlpD
MHAGSGFQWPVSGRVASRFSHRNGREGIEIQTRNGAEISAAESGIVMFCGYIPTLGNTVTVQHAFNVLSVYSYLSEIDTECGKRVQKGDRIGRAGTSGSAQHARLHFRIYVNYRGPKDPLDFLDR